MSFRGWRLVVIVAAGLGLGLGWNAWSGRGLALGSNAFVRPGDDVELVEAAAAKARLDQGALFLDARGIDYYVMGHIPGALPLPEDDFERAYARLEDTLRRRFDIVVYCSGYGCEASHIVARKLRERGVEAAILHEGWPSWTEAGYPVTEGEEP
ncbi:MAG TPA: rhodanese-like domain-containing protein [Vicinamibacteria bacterium]|nr:rhodanese-like domain-containing protein [Vicinamibacteria bacterium]